MRRSKLVMVMALEREKRGSEGSLLHMRLYNLECNLLISIFHFCNRSYRATRHYSCFVHLLCTVSAQKITIRTDEMLVNFFLFQSNLFVLND